MLSALQQVCDRIFTVSKLIPDTIIPELLCPTETLLYLLIISQVRHTLTYHNRRDHMHEVSGELQCNPLNTPANLVLIAFAAGCIFKHKGFSHQIPCGKHCHTCTLATFVLLVAYGFPMLLAKLYPTLGDIMFDFLLRLRIAMKKHGCLHGLIAFTLKVLPLLFRYAIRISFAELCLLFIPVCLHRIVQIALHLQIIPIGALDSHDAPPTIVPLFCCGLKIQSKCDSKCSHHIAADIFVRVVRHIFGQRRYVAFVIIPALIGRLILFCHI